MSSRNPNMISRESHIMRSLPTFGKTSPWAHATLTWSHFNQSTLAIQSVYNCNSALCRLFDFWEHWGPLHNPCFFLIHAQMSQIQWSVEHGRPMSPFWIKRHVFWCPFWHTFLFFWRLWIYKSYTLLHWGRDVTCKWRGRWFGGANHLCINFHESHA